MPSDKVPEFDYADAIAETLKDLPAEVKSRVMQTALTLVEATYETLKDLPAEVRAKALRSALYLLGVEVEEQAQETGSEPAGNSAPSGKASPPPEVWHHYVGEQLFRAVDHNDRAAAEEALKIGADVNHVSSWFYKGVTAFCYACLQGNEEMIRLFLDEGSADPNAELDKAFESSLYPISPLMMAVRDRRGGVVRLLLERGADPNYRYHFETKDGAAGYWTPLGVAVSDASLAIVEMLLEKGASEDSVMEYEGEISTALDVAKQHFNDEVTRFLKARQTAKGDAAKTEPGQPAPPAKSSALPPRDAALVNVNEQLLRAIERDDLYDAVEALKNGANVYYQHDSDESAFVAALKRGNAEMVGLFLDHGADPNAQLSNAYEYQVYSIEPLMLAVLMGHEDVVKLLLERGATSWQWHQFGKDDDGVGFTTPLGKAAEKGFKNIVKILLDHGARDDDGYSDVSWQGGQAHTAKDWAEKHGQQEVARLLEERQRGKADDELAHATHSNEASAAEALTVDKLKFNIAYVSQPRWYDEWFAELIDGQITFGDHIEYFTTAFTRESSWSRGTYEGQWSEAVVRLLNGYDRTVFVLNFGTCEGFQTWLMWREGETIYAAFNWAREGEFDPDHPYDKLPSYETEKQHRREFRELKIQDIRDFFLMRGMASVETREELGRPCAQCGEEMRRCNGNYILDSPANP